MSMRKNLNVVYRESKWISDDELLGIAFDENGVYSAYDLLVGEGSKTWIGGTSASGTGYRNIYDATLMVSNSYYLYAITIYPISYSVVNNGYDSFIDTGIATSPIMPCLTAYPVQMQETAQSEAYACYDAKNVFKIEQSSEVSFPIEIRISNNNVYVYLLGVQI